MIVDKDGKLFGKISIIDIIVVIAIVVAGFGMYSRFVRPNEKIITENQQIEYTMQVKDVKMATIEALQNYSPIYDDDTKEYLGEIVNVEYKDAVEDTEMPNGEMKAMKVPGKYEALVTVRVDGKVNQSGYYTANNQALNAGASHLFLSKYAKTTGRIINVKEIK